MGKKVKKNKKPKKSRKPRDRAKPLSEKDLKKLVGHVREHATTARLHGTSRAIIDEVIVDLLVEAGLKPQELCKLRLIDTPVHHTANIISVRSERGHRTRDIPVSQELAERLKRFSSLYRQGAKSKDPLILSERGNPLGYFSIYSKIRRIGQGAGIKHLQPNALRKTYIANLFAKEKDLRLVQQQAGHSRPKTTALYVQPAKPKAKSPSRKKCEACGRRVSTNRIAQIDSGQVLCANCLKELRG